MPQQRLLAAATFIVVLLLLLISIWFIARRFLRWAVRLASRDNTLLGNDPRARLLGLGIAVVFFPSVVGRFVMAAVYLFLGLLYGLPAPMARGWEAVQKVPCMDDHEVANCMVQSGLLLTRAVGEGLGEAFSYARIGDLPLGRLVLFLTVWAFASGMMGAVGSDDASSPLFQRARKGIAQMAPASRANTLFFTILVIGAYLSLAAIAAIPDLQAPPASAEVVGVPRLAANLKQAAVPFVAPASGTDPLLGLEQLLNAADSARAARSGAARQPQGAQPPASPAGATPAGDTTAGQARQPTQRVTTASKLPARLIPDSIPDEQLRAVRESIEEYRLRRGRLLADHGSAIVVAEVNQTQAIQNAIIHYEVENLDRRGSGEQRQHFLEVTAWFRRQRAQLDRRLGESYARVKGLDLLAAYWANYMRQYLLEGRPDTARFNSLNTLGSLETNLPPLNSEEFVEESLPERPRLGSGLGPFRWVSAWLLRTESLALALITGMLGFGLLGAAASTFVREHTDEPGRSKDDPLVKDLTGVVIRGGSAAVVVFLGVMGGLAVFSSRDPNPNPYVLLFTCLVGAVFSERVWTWAAENLKLSGRNADEENGGGDGGNGNGGGGNGSGNGTGGTSGSTGGTSGGTSGTTTGSTGGTSDTTSGTSGTTSGTSGTTGGTSGTSGTTGATSGTTGGGSTTSEASG
jgi:hypothetical protein